MMHSIKTFAFIGSQAKKIQVECDISAGLPHFSIVGLPDSSIQESKERVRSALKNSGFKFPAKRITVNLAPTGIRKTGSSFDFPIALALLASEHVWKSEWLEKSIIFGELSLDGNLRSTSWALPATIAAKKEGFKYIFLPKQNTKEASFVKDICVIGIEKLSEAVKILETVRPWKIQNMRSFEKISLSIPKISENIIRFEDIRGQKWAKRALEIAIAWWHHTLLSGPPWSGKSMLARGVESILPSMTEDLALETSSIHSIAWLLSEEHPILLRRPFRSVYHTATPLSLTGGGSRIQPGEMALAHHGILFLDEFREFQKEAIEILREPLEMKKIRISRASGSYEYPANFSLIATTNPCPCGYLWDPEKECICSSLELSRYERRISGPILDRIDLHIHVPRIKTSEYIWKNEEEETSEIIQNRIEKVRKIQENRLGFGWSNGDMNSIQVAKFCPLTKEASILLSKATDELVLSGRSYYRTIKVARTIADFEESEIIGVSHIAEALSYRKK